MITAGASGLEEDIQLRWRVNNEDVTLNLHENTHVTSRAPVLISRNGVISVWNSTKMKVTRIQLLKKINDTNEIQKNALVCAVADPGAPTFLRVRTKQPI